MVVEWRDERVVGPEGFRVISLYSVVLASDSYVWHEGTGYRWMRVMRSRAVCLLGQAPLPRVRPARQEGGARRVYVCTIDPAGVNRKMRKRANYFLTITWVDTIQRRNWLKTGELQTRGDAGDGSFNHELTRIHTNLRRRGRRELREMGTFSRGGAENAEEAGERLKAERQRIKFHFPRSPLLDARGGPALPRGKVNLCHYSGPVSVTERHSVF